MSEIILGEFPTITTVAAGDFVPIWRAVNEDTRKVTKANFIGAVLTGGGTIVTDGFSLTLPATGTAALLATANTFTAQQTVSARLTANSYRSGFVTLTDDTATSFASPVSGGIIFLFATNGTTGQRSRTGAAVFQNLADPIVLIDAANFEASGSVLNGTTGTDAKWTFSYNGGNIYIENRSGSTCDIGYVILG